MNLLKLILKVACYSFFAILIFDYTLTFIMKIRYWEILSVIYFFLYFFVVYAVLLFVLPEVCKNKFVLTITVFTTFLAYQFIFWSLVGYNLAWQRSLMITVVSIIPVVILSRRKGGIEQKE